MYFSYPHTEQQTTQIVQHEYAISIQTYSIYVELAMQNSTN